MNENAELQNGRWAMIGFLSRSRCICHNRSNYSRSILMTPEAERFNGWSAMIGFVAAIGAYATTGQIIPGIF